MLIHNYSTQVHRTPNNATLAAPNQSQAHYKLNGLVYPTASLDTFSTITPSQLNTLFDEQFEAMTKEADDLLQYNLLSKSSHALTITQYKHNYFHTDNLAYRKSDLLAYSSKLHRQSLNSLISNITPSATTTDQPQSVLISRQAIRDIT